jgi:large subunit ribosomal protein L35
MPKQKTKKIITKRFKITKKGKVMRRQAFRRHLKAAKSKKRLRNLKKVVELTGPMAKKIRKVMGK